MRIGIGHALIAALVLSGCGIGQSRLNPLNWFGGSEEVVADRGTDDEGYTPLGDPRPLVDQVTALSVSQMPGGAIVTARGLPPRQGHYDVALFPENDGDAVDGVLTFTFRTVPPPGPTRQGPEVSREVVASAFVNDFTLARTRTIRVEAARNARQTRR